MDDHESNGNTILVPRASLFRAPIDNIPKGPLNAALL
jgi:hypothetical protein